MKYTYLDLINKLVVVLSVEYVILFGIEVILPGVITNVFNINILLVCIFVLLGILVVRGSKKVENIKKITPKWLFIAGGFFLVFICSIALYKVSTGMIILYISSTGVIINLLWKHVKG